MESSGAAGRCHGNHFWLSIYGVHIGATWRMRLNRPCAAAMRPYVKLPWPLVLFTNWGETLPSPTCGGGNEASHDPCIVLLYTVGHTKEPTRHGSLLTFWRFTNRIIIIIIINLFLFVTSSKQRILMLYSLLDLKNERYIRRHQFYPSHPSNVATLPCGFSKHWKCNITAGYCQRKLHEMYGSFIEMDQGHVPYINTIECLSKVYKNCKHMTQRHDLLYS